ncbi:hypothetical protein JL722_14877 [Aureococcus anophagefferens]|nr:hypothetical protein JL722_14877 [Aureococcus anophagefferens]
MQALAALAAALVVAGALLLFAVSDTTPTDALWESLAGRGHRLGLGVEHYRKGKSDVLESGHTVILGWSDKLFGVLEQLCLANESLGGGVVVLLSDKPKEEQEDARAAAGADQADARSLRVALSFVSEARHCAPASDRCIVMEMQDVDNEPLVQLVGGDHVETIVTHDLIGRLMIQSARHPGLAQVWSMLLGFDGCEFYIKHHAELDGVSFGDAFLRFDDAVPIGVIQGSGKDATIWVNPEDDLVLRPGDKLIVIAEDDDTYAPRTRPLEVEVASPSDGDLRTFRDDRALSMDDDNAERPECVLFCGWRRDMDDIVQVLDEFVTPGSGSTFSASCPRRPRPSGSGSSGRRGSGRWSYQFNGLPQRGLLCSRRDLEEKLPISSLSSIVILAEESEDLDATSKDSQALTTLLLLRDIQSTQPPAPGGARRAATPAKSVDFVCSSESPDRPRRASVWDSFSQSACDATDAVHAAVADAVLSPRSLDSPSPRSVEAPASSLSPSNSSGAEPRPKEKCQIISEILDSRASKLIADAQISDYVLSNDLVANALAMIAEDRTVNKLLKILMESRRGGDATARRGCDAGSKRSWPSKHADPPAKTRAFFVVAWKATGPHPARATGEGDASAPSGATARTSTASACRFGLPRRARRRPR